MTGTTDRYTKIAIWLHWITAALMIGMLIFGEELMELEEGQSLVGWQPNAHASVGMLILLLALARIFWRIAYPPPDLPAHMQLWERTLSHISHWAFYGLMIAIPVFGLLALRPFGTEHTGAESISFFGLFPLSFAPDLGEWTAEVHEILSNVAIALVVLHVLATLKHQFWDKDGLLRRMSPH